MYRVGIIGFGKMGMLHGALINGSKKARVVAICDKSKVMRFGAKRVYPEVKTFSDVNKMLAQMNLDVVLITTPTFNHKESAMSAIEKGCNIFIEKPLAVTYSEAAEIQKAADNKSVKVQVGFCNRFCPSISKGKEIFDSEVLGKIKEVNAYMLIADVLEAHTGWRYKKVLSGGGALMDFGIHMLDQICWYFGEVKDVTAEARYLYSTEVEDEVDTIMNFENEIKIKFSTSWSSEKYRKSYARMEIIGEKSDMIVTDQTLLIKDKSGNTVTHLTYPELYGGAYMDIGGINYSRQMECFFAILEEKVEKTNLADAVYDQKIVEEIYRSVENKSKIVVSNH